MKLQQAITDWKKQQQQLTLRSQCSTPTISEHTKELPVFFNQPLATQDDIKCELMKLKVRYPKMELEHLAILAQDLMQEGLSQEQLKLAVNNLARTHKYQTFTLADLLDYSPKVKLYTGDEVYKLLGRFPSRLYPRMKFTTEKGTIYKFVTREDAIEFNLEIECWNEEHE